MIIFVSQPYLFPLQGHEKNEIDPLYLSSAQDSTEQPLSFLVLWILISMVIFEIISLPPSVTLQVSGHFSFYLISKFLSFKPKIGSHEIFDQFSSFIQNYYEHFEKICWFFFIVLKNKKINYNWRFLSVANEERIFRLKPSIFNRLSLQF